LVIVNPLLAADETIVSFANSTGVQMPWLPLVMSILALPLITCSVIPLPPPSVYGMLLLKFISPTVTGISTLTVCGPESPVVKFAVESIDVGRSPRHFR
jgi:hypothetical protein